MQWSCKKEGNKGPIIRENGIVLYLSHEQHTYRNVLNIGLIHFPLLLDPCVMRYQEQEEQEEIRGTGTSLENSFVFYNHAVL